MKIVSTKRINDGLNFAIEYMEEDGQLHCLLISAEKIVKNWQAVEHRVQPTVLTHCQNDGNLLLMGFCDQCKSQYPHSG